MNYRLSKLLDCIPLVCFWETKKREKKKASMFLGSLMVKWWHKSLPLRLFVGTTPTLRNWTVGATSCSILSAYLVNVEYVGNGSVCILECKVLFILQEIVPVSKGNVSPGWFFFLVLQSITFCMSSVLFDWYSNALSVCLVLVVNLLRQHLMFLLLLPNHLAYDSKVNAHSFFFFHWVLLCLSMVTGFFFCLLLSSSWQSKWRSGDPQTEE